ncbi:MAG TPA: tyrosine-type recombinase/integrase [Ktedonobacteraceae bacterium]|nr:tyrosine-type recombinase/integrase [Ktedonobacteraceae bacterium]
MAPHTLDAYARGLDDFLGFCERSGIAVVSASRGDLARYIGDLRARPHPHPSRAASPLTPPLGLSNATLQQRLTAVRLFFDFLIEEGLRRDHPVGRGRYTPGKSFGAKSERGLVPRYKTLPWLPNDEQWRAFLEVVKQARLRTRCMAALAYDAGLRREELCTLQSTDLDPAHRMLRVRAEIAKGSRERVVPYSATSGELLRAYLLHRRTIAHTRGPLFLSESPRNYGEPITLWTWSKVVRQLALQADLPEFSTHTFRHLCLTDLARSGWEVHQIAQFAGHRNPATTLLYIHLSGHDLAEQFTRGMSQIHAWRVQTLARTFDSSPVPPEDLHQQE